MNDPQEPLAFSLDRELVIRAPRAMVFRFFTDSARWASWWGKGSSIEPRVGGAIRIVYPGNVGASGRVLAIEPTTRLSFSYGYDSGAPIPPGGSRVAITLADHPEGTHLVLRHDVADAATRDHHVQGWRYQLAVFANAVANEAHAGAAATVDRWFAAWSAEAEALPAAFEGLVVPGIEFRDGFSCIQGVADLIAHVSAARQHMPGVAMARDGAARHCQGTLLADWIAAGADGKRIGRGTNAFTLAADGRVASVVGFWSQG
jgi:uncharacterized protein YndB with AHSA1/START domain